MNKKRGFTLVELLATIVVLALIFSITIFIATNLIKKNKENTYKVTINEIESNASNYLIENSGRLFYLTKDENTEYQCITVENLVDYGYLDNNITNSLVSDNVNVKKTDYIYIERDSATKTVTKTIYVSNNSDTKKTCDKAVIALGDIVFTYSPALNTWSRYKDITITYRLRNLNDQRELDNYLFNHSFNGTSSYDKNNDTLINNIKTKKIRITSKGILMASITYDNEELAKKSQNITKIDTTAPKIAKGTYTGENTVRSTVTIPLTVTDSESGVDYKSFTNDDLVVKVGTTTVKDYTLTHGTGDNYSLKINSDLYDGKVVLTIAKDKVLDKVLNGNEDTTIDTGITFDNTYKITYNANGGSGAPKATTYKYATSGNTNITSDKPTKTGYTFLGWAETSTATKVKYKSGDVYSKNIKKDITLYALWVINKVYVKYHINGGTWAGSTNTHLNVANSYVTYDKSADAFVTNYGGTINLADWNNSSYINIKRTGHTPKKGYEWCTKSDGTGNCYNQSTDYTKVGTDTAASHFCDARTVSCTVTLYANWVANTYKITYNANGGSGAPSATTYTYATSGTVSLSSAIPTRKGYIFLGWAESSSATNAKYQTGDIYSKGIDKNVTLYAVWSTDTFFDGVGHYGFAIAGSNSASRGESREKASATSKWVVAPPTDSRYNNVLASLKKNYGINGLDNISGSRLNTNGGTIKRLIFSYFAYGNTGTPYEQTIFNGRILLIKPDFSYTFIPYSNKGWGWAEYIEITDYVNKTSPDGWYYVSFIGSKVAPQAAWSMTAVYENGRTLPNSYTKLVLKQQQIANASVDIRFPIPYQINGTYQITGTILGGGIGAWPGAPNETNDRVFAILKDGSTKQLYETYYNGRTIFAGRSSSDFACGIFNTEKNHSVRGGELDIFNETLRSDFFGNKELVGIRFTKDGNNGISVGLVGVSAPLK